MDLITEIKVEFTATEYNSDGVEGITYRDYLVTFLTDEAIEQVMKGEIRLSQVIEVAIENGQT